MGKAPVPCSVVSFIPAESWSAARLQPVESEGSVAVDAAADRIDVHLPEEFRQGYVEWRDTPSIRISRPTGFYIAGYLRMVAAAMRVWRANVSAY